MINNKKNNITKKLQNLVKHRKTQIVVSKQGSNNYITRNSSSDSVESYCYNNYNS